MNDGFHSNLQVQSMVIPWTEKLRDFRCVFGSDGSSESPALLGGVGAVVKLRLDIAARVLISPGVGSTVLVQVADIPIVV